LRTLAVAIKRTAFASARFSRSEETELELVGVLLFLDPPKPDVATTLAGLASRGVSVKVVSGDSLLVVRHVAESVGLPADDVLTGRDLDSLGEEALVRRAVRTTVFAEVDPNQKERVIRALRRAGCVVGYLGDGINDAPALRAADVGITVDSAVDVAKEAADLLLLERELDVLKDGIDVGRTTFANTLKYVLTTVSANFGNMLSMALASFWLPFLPLLASQILLNNFLSDIPGLAISTDRVDADWTAKPRRWNVAFIGRFMAVFGLVSSAIDMLTFGLLLLVFRATVDEFRTGWFVESLLTELVIALVVRTRLPFFRSRPSLSLGLSTLGVISLTLALPYLPFASMLGFVPLSLPLTLALIGLTALYVLAAEATKKVFYERIESSSCERTAAF
jgi:Mg2+-importing ATPase